MKNLKLFEEFVDGLHFEEKFRIEYDKVLDPFPIYLDCWFEKRGEVFDFGFTETHLKFIRKEDDDHLDWGNLRQLLYETTTNDTKDFHKQTLTITKEGLDKIAKTRELDEVNNYWFHFLIEIKDLDQLIMSLESIYINTYKKYKSND